MLAETLKSLMQKKPLSKISVSEIVNACQINRKTFYYHFADIYELLEWQIEQEILEFTNNVIDVFDFETIFTLGTNYIEQNTYLSNCVNDPIACDKLTQLFDKKFYPITLNAITQIEEHYGKSLDIDYKQFVARQFSHIESLCVIDTIKHKNTIDKEKMLLYFSNTFKNSLDGIFEKL
ncbi:MAG: TetR family transcriptional regulator [Lachnospiraceae bacterium]|nr:TetR family transcriptional regulator [Lachnospiraceae bacterium]